MNEMSAEYIRAHLHSIHDYDSWGKALAQYILQEAQAKVETASEGGVDSGGGISLSLPVTVVKVENIGCIDICVGIPPFQICKHVVP